MKTITKIGISAISAVAAAGAGYLGKKMYDKSKNKSADTITTESATESEITNVSETIQEDCTE